MQYEELREMVYKAAVDSAKRGAGYAQERVVLEEIMQRLSNEHFNPLAFRLQQAILTCWHDLFREGRLSWGHDLDNPDAPFFHIPNRDEVKKP